MLHWVTLAGQRVRPIARQLAPYGVAAGRARKADYPVVSSFISL